MELSVVIPVYGCPAALDPLYKRLTDTLSSLVASYEIILVNDACPKGSWSEIEKICAADSHVVGLELSRNFGQIKAITAGLDQSRGDWVVVMDCDLQDRPEEIRRLYAKAHEGYDVVFARRAVRHDSALKIWMSNRFYALYSFASGVKYDPALCNFSIVSRKVADAYCSMRELHRAYIIYIQWIGFRQTAIDVDHDERYEGQSGYNFKKRMRMAIDILTSQSDKLLRVTAITGMIIAVIALIAMLIIIIRYFLVHQMEGWTSLITSVFLMGGLTMMSIGIVGIYVGNIFMQVKERPLYITRTILNGVGPDKQHIKAAKASHH